MDDLHNELSSNPPLPGSYTARKGDLCAALFVDNNWYVTDKFVDSINREETYSCRSPPHPPLRLLYPFHPTEHIPRLIMYVINLVPRVSGWYVILLHSSPQGGIIVRVCTFHLSSDVIY